MHLHNHIKTSLIVTTNGKSSIDITLPQSSVASVIMHFEFNSKMGRTNLEKIFDFSCIDDPEDRV